MKYKVHYRKNPNAFSFHVARQQLREYGFSIINFEKFAMITSYTVVAIFAIAVYSIAYFQGIGTFEQ